jgi:hypothetical protein
MGLGFARRGRSSRFGEFTHPTCIAEDQVESVERLPALVLAGVERRAMISVDRSLEVLD